MLPFPESFEQRPVCFVGLAAGIWGALRPVEQLQAIFGYRNAYIFPERVFMPGIGKLLNEAGAIQRVPTWRNVCEIRRKALSASSKACASRSSGKFAAVLAWTATGLCVQNFKAVRQTQ